MVKKIEYIKKIDNDKKLYKTIFNEKLFINNNLARISDIEKSKFFSHIFEQEKNKAKRLDNYHFK
jgi:rubrerythrin